MAINEQGDRSDHLRKTFSIILDRKEISLFKQRILDVV
jgi:hypothetical protein